ncbi:type II secretion system protein [Planctomycetota bacterium]
MADLKHNSRRAFTLVEVLVSAIAAVILIVGISAMLFYGQRGYNTMYRRVHSEIVRNAYEARKVFDAVVRKSTIERYDPAPPDPSEPYIGNQLCVYYYSDPGNPAVTNNVPDRYAWFHLEGTDLIMEQGPVSYASLPPQDLGVPSLPTPDKNMVIARNVVNAESGIFFKQGAALRMVMILDDETNPAPNVHSDTQTLKMIVTTTAIRHNKIRQ